MNTFFNSVFVKSLPNTNNPDLNFGDVFEATIEGKKKYFLCITALCDCFIPNKIKHNYYFVEGDAISIELANTLGDTAFISYLSQDLAISWVIPDYVSTSKINNDSKSDLERQLLSEKAKSDLLNTFRYKPAYIKPRPLNIEGSKIIDNKITAREITYVSRAGQITEDLPFYIFNYIGTIRPNYTQRIANHAFSHPIRVGVDFVKK